MVNMTITGCIDFTDGLAFVPHKHTHTHTHMVKLRQAKSENVNSASRSVVVLISPGKSRVLKMSTSPGLTGFGGEHGTD